MTTSRREEMAVSISKPRVDTPVRPGHARIKIGSVIGITLLVLFSLFALVPFLWMLSTALKTRAEVFTFPPILIPPEPRWENFARVFEAFPFLKYARNSLFVTVNVTIFQTLTSAM